jgi:hypothetical protein
MQSFIVTPDIPQQDVARDWTRRDGASAHSLRGRPHGQIWLTKLAWGWLFLRTDTSEG